MFRREVLGEFTPAVRTRFDIAPNDDVGAADYGMRLVDLLTSGNAEVATFCESRDAHETRLDVELRLLPAPRRWKRELTTREAAIRHMYRALSDETPGASSFEIFERCAVIFMELAAKERDKESR